MWCDAQKQYFRLSVRIFFFSFFLIIFYIYINELLHFTCCTAVNRRPSIMMYVNLFFLLRSSLLLSRSCQGGWERTPPGGKVEGQMVTDRKARRGGNEENRRFMRTRAANAFHSPYRLFCLNI